jgi:hypothetical protein
MAKRRNSTSRPPNLRKGGGSGRDAGRHIRRDVAILGGLVLVVFLAVAALGGAFLAAKADKDWASVATVNGRQISRETLRARMSVVGFLAQQRSAFDATKVLSGAVTSDQLPALQAATNATLSEPISAARESLIDDELVRQLAAREGVATPPRPDPWTEAISYVSADLARQVRVVRFSLPTASTPTPTSGSNAWPAASSANIAVATDRLRTELTGGTKVETIVAGLHDAGWTVFGENVALSADGVPADASLQLDPEIAAAALAAKPDDLLGPATDEYGAVTMALALTPADTAVLRSRIESDATAAKVDTSALAEWAAGQALRRALSAALLDRAKTKGVTLAHFRELVVGASPDSTGTAGPWVELSGLSLDRLASIDPSAVAGAPAGLDLHADALATRLRAMGPADRIALWKSLVTAANAGSDSNRTSGEIGFATKDGLAADLGKAAFDDKVKTADVLGPITTATGTQLFLVEARYSGALDERAQAALREIRADASPDPLAYTTRFSPADIALARDAGWRADAEFGSSEPVRSALFDTLIGVLSDPFVLDGKLALAIVDDRHVGIPAPRTVARLTLDGYAAWYQSERTKATITRSDNPLPELAPSASPSPTAAGTLPSMPAIATPNLPSIPGVPAATPVKTDALGLPVRP